MTEEFQTSSWRANVVWFNNVGIVRQKNKFVTKYYIKEIRGHDEFSDYTSIINWGNTFPKEAGDVLFSVANGVG